MADTPEFEIYDGNDQLLIYLGLRKLIESCDGTGFHNGDLGHSVYLMGARGEDSTTVEYADSPDKNRLFQILSTLSKKYKETGDTAYNWWYDFSTWQSFCQFVVECYQKNKKGPNL